MSLLEQELQMAFGDPDRVNTAVRQMRETRQKTSASSYAASFKRYALLTGWDDKSMRDQFYLGLKEEIKDEMARIGKPAKLDDLIQAAIRIDGRLYERQ